MSGTILSQSSRTTANAPNPAAAWRSLKWFGFVITTIGLGQLALYFFPASGFGSPEWEYGASAQMIGALPLPTVGLGILMAGALATGSRKGMIGLGILFVLLALAVFVVLALFWTVAPMALRATPDPASGTIKQAIARTTLSGIGFGLLYLGAAFVALRQTRSSSRSAVHA